jgi:hypothetical protein
MRPVASHRHPTSGIHCTAAATCIIASRILHRMHCTASCSNPSHYNGSHMSLAQLITKITSWGTHTSRRTCRAKACYLYRRNWARRLLKCFYIYISLCLSLSTNVFSPSTDDLISHSQLHLDGVLHISKKRQIKARFQHSNIKANLTWSISSGEL